MPAPVFLCRDIESYFLPLPLFGGLLPRPSPLGFPVVLGLLAGPDDPFDDPPFDDPPPFLAIGFLLS